MVAIFNLRNLTFMRMLRRLGQHVVLNLLLLMKDVSLPGLSLCILLLTPSLPPNQSVLIHTYFFYHLAKGDRGNNAWVGGGEERGGGYFIAWNHCSDGSYQKPYSCREELRLIVFRPQRAVQIGS